MGIAYIDKYDVIKKLKAMDWHDIDEAIDMIDSMPTTSLELAESPQGESLDKPNCGGVWLTTNYITKGFHTVYVSDDCKWYTEFGDTYRVEVYDWRKWQKITPNNPDKMKLLIELKDKVKDWWDRDYPEHGFPSALDDHHHADMTLNIGEIRELIKKIEGEK